MHEASGAAVAQAGILPSPFYFLRHGESENNLLDRVNGWTDSALTAHGRSQAEAAAARLVGANIRLVLTSPLSRARETAEIVAARIGAPVHVIEALMERNWGVLENGPRAQLTDYFMVPEGGESWDEYRTRVWDALTGPAMVAGALVVGHAGTMRVLRHGLRIGDVTDRLPNALPVRFARAVDGAWGFAPVGR